MNEKYKIIPNDVTINPIDSFYKKIFNSIDEIINSFLDSYKEKYQNVFDYQQEIINDIKENKNDILKMKNELKIKKIKCENIFIGLGFAFLVGLFFLKKFNANRKTIKNFNSFKNIKNNIIFDLESKKHSLSIKFFSCIVLEKLIKQISESYGIKFRNDIPKVLYENIMKNKNVLEVTNSFAFQYKNTPLIDVLTKELRIKNITTSRSQTFSYTDIEYHYDDKGQMKSETVTKYETLTAYHTEPTPFIEEENNLYYFTNFKPNLHFWSNSNWKYIEFENHDFSKKYRIDNYENKVNSDMLQFFTIKAQEDYLQWFKFIDTTPNVFEKRTNWIKVKNEKIYFPLKCNNLNIQKYLSNEGGDIGQFLTRLKIEIKNYFLNFSQNAMLGLLSPVINRESYNLDKHYKIQQHIDGYELNLNNNFFESNYHIVKKIKSDYISFINEVPAKELWTTIDDISIINGVSKYAVNINSYKSTHLMDPVVVTGFNVGPKTINVPYIKYTPITENKVIYSLDFENIDIPEFCIGKNLFNNYFNISLKNQKSEFNDVGFWTENPKYFEENNDNKTQQIKTLIKEIWSEINDNDTFHLSNNSLSFICNLQVNDDEYYVNKLKNIFKQINNL